jgi:hypothetical protein
MITKLYYEEYVYLFHGELKLYLIVKFMEENVTKSKNLVFRWKCEEDMIVILR